MPIFHDGYNSRPQSPGTGNQSSPTDMRSPILARISSKGGSRAGSQEREQNEEALGTTAFSDIQATSNLEGRRNMSREELIERIKRQKSPTSRMQHRNIGVDGQASPRSRASSPRPSASPLLPALELVTSPNSETEAETTPSNNDVGLQIERPRSALHSGDFRPNKDSTEVIDDAPNALATSPVVPWHRDFPISAHPKTNVATNISQAESTNQRAYSRNRAISQSSLSKIVLMAPTSPLVHQSNNTDLDFSPKVQPRSSSRSPTRDGRRHTFSPHSFQTFRSTIGTGTPDARHLPSLRREGTYPLQAHQPRRSLSNIPNVYSNSTPQTPLLSARRPSIAPDVSPLYHAPMVGSYEESILRGRMSTTPSKPLNFLAQIGVLGKGNCRANLKCPPHVTVPFPAVFYSYISGTGRATDDSPSPYVGLIDLENSLKPLEEKEDTSWRRKRARPSIAQSPHVDSDEVAEVTAQANQRKQEKKKRRSTSPRTPPGGCYRIPQQGQLQIVIKNPNKTAVKLFLVPYDLSDMDPGQKTFIRQRSYSAGAILDIPLASRNNFGTDRPEASLSHSDDPNDRPVLRYLIHLNICCPSRNRYYLYKGVRVVFANRVPDGKEKLRNEVQLPEPRYSMYKSSRESAIFSASSSAATQLAADLSNRRRSSGFGLSQQMLDGIDGFGGQTPTNAYPRFSSYNNPSPAFSPVPFCLSRMDTLESRPLSRDQQSATDCMEIDSPTFDPFQTRQNTGMSQDGSRPNSNSTSSPSPQDREQFYQKFTRGTSGYISPQASSGSQQQSLTGGEGLLARKLRGLDM